MRAAPAHLTALELDLTDDPTSFDFFQAVRALERLRPAAARVGGFADPESEGIRFSVNPSLAFPPAQLHSLMLPEKGPARMVVNFFGLTGPLGVLPYQYTLLLIERLRARDGAPAAFLDLFHHRIISLFYRAWEKNRVTVGFENTGSDRIAEHLLDLVGQGTAEGQELSPLHRKLLFYVGLLGPQPRGPVALQQLLEDMFDVPVEVEQFVGGWYPLAREQQCAIGDETGMPTQLGIGSVAGDEVWDEQMRVRLRLGPLSGDRYADFLPSGSAHALLRWLVRFFSRDAFDFELQLVLERDAVPPCVLGDDAAAPQPLGWSTWLRTRAMERDPEETILPL
jgi:type VI secretion system protein ImpH